MAMSNVPGWSLVFVFVSGLSLILFLSNGCTEASIYHIKGMCSYKNKYYKPGDSFRRGCDKCYCHNFGSYCFAPMKPTSWPRECQRLRTECGYKVVYERNPLLACPAYSWIG